MGFAAYFRLVISREAEFRLLYGRDHADDKELGLALRTVEDAIAAAIEPLIDAGLDDDHRRLLAYAVVGMAEGASRRFMEQRTSSGGPGRRRSGTAGTTHGRPGLGRPEIRARRLITPGAASGTPPPTQAVTPPIRPLIHPSRILAPCPPAPPQPAPASAPRRGPPAPLPRPGWGRPFGRIGAEHGGPPAGHLGAPGRLGGRDRRVRPQRGVPGRRGALHGGVAQQPLSDERGLGPHLGEGGGEAWQGSPRSPRRFRPDASPSMWSPRSPPSPRLRPTPSWQRRRCTGACARPTSWPAAPGG